MKRTCPICGKIFETKTCGKYCSDECRKKKVYQKRVYKKSCALCGDLFATTSYKIKYCSTECRLEAQGKGGESSLCWQCQNYAGGCSWSRHFIPVKGWVAVPVENGNSSPSYRVKKCPEFIKDLPRR